MTNTIKNGGKKTISALGQGWSDKILGLIWYTIWILEFKKKKKNWFAPLFQCLLLSDFRGSRQCLAGRLCSWTSKLITGFLSSSISLGSRSLLVIIPLDNCQILYLSLMHSEVLVHTFINISFTTRLTRPDNTILLWDLFIDLFNLQRGHLWPNDSHWILLIINNCEYLTDMGLLANRLRLHTPRHAAVSYLLTPHNNNSAQNKTQLSQSQQYSTSILH